MQTIIDKLQQYTEQNPGAPILFDDLHSKGITYAQLDDMSGRVYAWLKENKIGREDFVLIDLPRGVLPVIAMIGVWKAGAAWALVEDTYAPERIQYIRTDCGCKQEISADNWDDIMRVSPLQGHEDPDEHDAAYAIYTSGTTGNPKGVLHEYGNLQRAIDSIRIDGVVPFTEKDRLATLAPMNFVATVIVILSALNVYCGKNYIVSYSTIKNTAALAKFFLSKRITITFLTPSYVRKIGNNTGPFLRMLFVGSEPANNLYNKNLDLINIYACSESGFAVGFFKIDKPYETCPIGKPQVETEITLIGEDGKEVADGETGELCFTNPYVRGYINLPEETAKAFVNGVYHTGDLAAKDENGNYVLLGRSGDMIKINGNRIEPAEIEAAVKQALNIDWCAARGFEEEGKSYLCAYYTADVKFDPSALREELLKRLPYYMIPAYFMKIESVPLKASGKLDRKALPAPGKIAKLYMDSLAQNDGVAPEVKEKEAREKEHPLTTEQLYMVDYQLYTPNSTMYNLYSMMKLDKDAIDMEKMAETLKAVISHHPALLTKFSWNRDRELVQSYHPEELWDIHVEKLTEFELRYVRDTLVYPFKIVGGRLCRCRVFETEKAGYVFFDVHHSVFDGTSLKVFMNDIGKTYLGLEADPDFYYLMLQRREDAVNSAFYEESRRYFEKRYDRVDWSCFPQTDHESRDNEMGELFAPLGILQPQMNAMEKAYKISRNEFFITVAALAISIYNRTPDVKISWIYNGREDMENMTTVGLLFRDLPIGIRFKDRDTLRNVFADVHEQVQKGIEHSCYPYVDSRNQAGESECAYLLYQQDIRDMGGKEGFDVEMVDIRQNQAASQTILDMEILDGAEGLTLMIDFAASLYKEESMERFKDIYVKLAQALVTHNSQADVTIGEIREKLDDHKNFFKTIAGIFSRKK